MTKDEIVGLRERLRLTQAEFADALGVAVATVSRWENGHRVASVLAVKAIQRLADEMATKETAT